VAAASSLSEAFTEYGREFDVADVRLSFAGSDQLAAQIRQGAEPDVFAAASTILPRRLRREGLVSSPVAFASNSVVVATPAGERAIDSVSDLADPGLRVAIGSPSVPIGVYSREVLTRLPKRERDAILANVASNEPEVAGIVGKLSQGAVDAGFVYRTDVRAVAGELRAIELFGRLRPAVAYGAVLVDGAAHPEEAREFIDGLLSGPGREALRAAGFGPAPVASSRRRDERAAR
jgi:molybdate transport system substrate-binding protein